VTLTARDPDGASDVASTHYAVDSGSIQTYAGPFSVTGDGIHIVIFYSVDHAGNTETAKGVAILIDTVPPVTSASVAGATVTLTAADATSGVLMTNYQIDGGAAQVYTGPFTVTGTGSHTVVYESTDIAGNVEAAHSLSIVFNPAPSIASISPTSTTACSLPVVLTINGTNFVNGATAKWNGTPLATLFVSSTQLTATVPGTDTSATGTFAITVDNPTPEAGSSNSKPFTVTPNPLPVLTSISPASVTADTAAFTLTANGSNFTPCSTVMWNGSALATSFVSATKLTASVPASDITATGTVTIAVTTPAPGGGTSAGKPITIIAPALTMVTVTPNSVTGGATSTGKVTLNAPALAGGQTVMLASNNSAASVPSTWIVPGGATSVTFTITTSPVAADTAVTITATLGAVSKTALLTVKAPAPMTLQVVPSSVFGGMNATCTVTLTGQTPAGGITVALGTSNSSVANPGTSVLVPGGVASAQFPIATFPVSANTNVTLSAAFDGVTKTVILTVKPPAMSAASVSPSSVKGGTQTTLTVTLTSPAPSAGTTVTLTSGKPTVAPVPASVLIPSGATSTTVTINTNTVSTNTNVTLTATAGGVSKMTTLTVTP
jgi:hypothetical protein